MQRLNSPRKSQIIIAPILRQMARLEMSDVLKKEGADHVACLKMWSQSRQ